MIIIKYYGGLGNQMYIHALEKVLTMNYPHQTIKIDLNHYGSNYEHNGFELKKYFGVESVVANKKDIKKVHPYNFCEKNIKIFPKALNRYLNIGSKGILTIRKKIKKKETNIIQNYKHNLFNNIVFNLYTEDDYYIDGLWQNIEYFIDHKEDIIDEFKFIVTLSDDDNDLKKRLQNVQSVGIHLRGGDFLNSNHDLCNKKYYDEAIKELEKEVDNPEYFIFTDDVIYAEKLFSNLPNVHIVSHSSEESYIDMYFMSLCKKLIISNSTFSFWGAFLNKTNPTVFCPKYNYRDNLGMYEFSVPLYWKKINNI